MKKGLLIFAGLFLVGHSFAQKDKAKFYLSPQASLLVGEATSGQVLLGGGAEWKFLSAGIAAGFDMYRLRTIPVMAQLQKPFKAGKKQLWLYAEGGYNIPYLTSAQKQLGKSSWQVYQKQGYDGGLIAGGGAGVTMFENAKGRMVFWLGYNKKTMSEYYELRAWLGPQTIVWEPHSIKYNFQSWLLRLSYSF